MVGYALVKEGKVVNLILWDGVEMDFEDGVSAVKIEESDNVSIGFTYAKGKFTAPPLTEQQLEQQKQEVITVNQINKNQLMSEATQQIAVLQDAVDLEMATEKEATDLPLWKKYRVLLSRVDIENVTAISWPPKPA
ncbi:tail fiber assembly protein [Pantoea agglomerans]|uniref:tail fiber assembly protein n=1 Tax=Enterobacter agglomerans TaxID=549 RepID=UPI00320802E8